MLQVPILMYHWFREEHATSVSRSPQLEITPALFSRQMAYLHCRRYHAISLEDAVFKRRRELPPKPIVITFDDGTSDFLTFGKPVLDQYNFTATLFVVTGYVGQESTWDQHLGEVSRPLMDWQQLVGLKDSGYDVQSHTHTHRVFTEISDEDVSDELKRSSQAIEAEIGNRPHFIAYPRGFYASGHKHLVAAAGYAGACAVILRWRDLFRSAPYALKRMTIKGGESTGKFILRLLLAKYIPNLPPPSSLS